MSYSPRIFSIPIGLSFLTEAVRALLDNKLIENADMRDPAQLANCIIYVPSKRVARSLQSQLVEMMDNKAAFLPDIRPLGEVDEDDFGRFIEEFEQNKSLLDNPEQFLNRKAVINQIERQTLLARLIAPWRENLPNHIRAMFGRETIDVPTNTADALWLARNLASLMDEIETENVDWHNLTTIAPEDLAEWWQITVNFLQCIFEAWPAILAERNEINPASLRNDVLNEAAQKLERKNTPNLIEPTKAQTKPVLVFGSTGSIPAVAELIKTIAYLPNGAVILPGLDRDLDKQSFEKLDQDTNNPAIFAHPQFAFKKLLQRLNCSRENVRFLGNSTPQQRQREKWISEIFRPANTSEAWFNIRRESETENIGTISQNNAATLKLNATQIENNTAAKTETKPDLKTISAAKSNAKTNTEEEPETDTITETEAETEAGIKTETEVETKTKAHPTPETADTTHLIFEDSLKQKQNTQKQAKKLLANPAKSTTDYLSAISLIEAPTVREEALSIAISLRAALEDKNARAALITSDRVLARRVCGELARFGVKANDSGGTPLASSEPATLLQLLLSCIFSPGDAVALLSLLKHPLTRLGCTRPDLRSWVEDFEFFALRGGAGRINLGQADAYMDERINKKTNDNFTQNFEAEQLERALRLSSHITAAAQPLYKFSQKTEDVSLSEAVTATIETIENFGRDEQKSLKRLYAQEEGQKFIRFFRSLLANRSGLTFKPQEWPKILESLMADQSVEMRQNGHPRLFILGLFEARLQSFDTVIIAGLNEGSLPASSKNSPFMSRMMKLAVSLPPPEQKTGFTAHDISTLLAAKKVILTRALRVDNAPSIASRWLQRLQATITPQSLEHMKQRGNYYLWLAQKLDLTNQQENQQKDNLAKRPNPKPPVAWRPTRFSVTEIETLIRDPYAIYAKYVLGLKPLEPLIRDENERERGVLYHEILSGFGQFYVNENIKPIKEQASQYLLSLAQEEFKKLQLPPDIEALWWPRFTSLVPNYIDWEANLSQRKRLAEVKAEDTPINDTGSFLRGRADRIDILSAYSDDKQKLAEIIDFKTGSTPSKAQALSLASPQLALEAALLMRGAFENCPPAEIETLLYLRLKPDGQTLPEDITTNRGKKSPALDLVEKAWHQLDSLIRHFQNPDTGYLSRARPPLAANREGDYDHLARIFEWATNIGEEE